MNGQAGLTERYQPEIGAAVLSESPHWYAVRTRSRHEKLVARQLETQGIQSFLPVVTQTRTWSDRRKQVESPLFSGYTFLRIIPSSEDRVRVLKTHGVVSFVGVQGTGTSRPSLPAKFLTKSVPICGPASVSGSRAERWTVYKAFW
jgi:hypothetical protein